jgi:hypothetical protein
LASRTTGDGGQTADDDAPTPVEFERVGTHPLLIVAATVLTVFILTFVIYSVGDRDGQDNAAGGGSNLAGSSPGACGQGAPADPSYTVDLVSNPQPPRPEGTTFQLTLRHEGRPITGAKVCLTSDMPDMQHPGLTSVAKEGSGGRYEARLQFGMGGTWRTAVTIAEPDKPVVSLPLTIQVAQVQS